MTNEQEALLQAIRGAAFIVRDSRRAEVVSVAYGTPDSVVRKVRGWKCRSAADLMTEFGAAFQLFAGFGENWHALEECLCYLDEWLSGSGYVLVVEGAEQLLADQPLELQWFVAVMKDVAKWWAKPVVGNGRFDRPPRPFKILFEVSDPEYAPFARRLDDAHADEVSRWS